MCTCLPIFHTKKNTNISTEGVFFNGTFLYFSNCTKINLRRKFGLYHGHRIAASYKITHLMIADFSWLAIHGAVVKEKTFYQGEGLEL